MESKSNQALVTVNVHTLYSIVWISGSALIVLSWLGAVSNLVGWVGWSIATISTITIMVNDLSVKRKSQSVPSAPPLALIFRTAYWIVWILGTALVLLNAQRVVSDTIGSIGGGMTVIATIASLFYTPSAKRQTETLPEDEAIIPVDVTFTKTFIKIELADGRTTSAPLRWYPKLKDASADDLEDYEFQGTAIYWPELKADVSVVDVLAGVRPGD